ncbi:cation/H(+) antiporter 15-like [Carya illinoinensis]|uniref:cation/H(+) antiporter 15-like n=1 Tax=Carya illinoinensis TaxID=32201 RepID=UPI001C71C7CB|nr:cation/H(+) antiporter 15-like [Carya illinoinensis]
MSNILSIYNVSTVSRQEESWKAASHDHNRQLMIVCEKNIQNNVRSNGIWMGDNPLAHIFPSLLLQGTLAFVACRAIFYFVLRPLKQPKFVCSILGGILLGPSILGQKHVIGERLFPPMEMMVLETLSAIGEMYFNFLIAVKVDFSRVLSTNRKAWSVGATSFALPFPILLFLLVTCIKYIGVPRNIFCFTVATFVSASYIPAIANAWEELNLVTSEFGLLTSSCAFVHSLILWFLMPLSLVIAQKTLDKSIAATLSFFALALFTFLVVRPTIVWIIKKTPQGEPVREVFVVLTLIGVLVMGCLTDIVGLSLNLGAVLFGCIIPEGPPLASILVEKSEAFVSDILMPLWYFRVGIEMDVHSIYNWKAFVIFHCILLVAYFAKFVGLLLASLSFKIRPRHAVLLGLIMNCKGPIDVMAFFRWKVDKHVLDDQSYFVLVSSALAMTAFVTPLVEMFYRPQTLHEWAYNNPSKNPQGLRPIQNTSRNSKFPIICCIHNEENVRSIITLLEASNPTEASPICVYVIHLMDILGRAVPLIWGGEIGLQKTLKANQPLKVDSKEVNLEVQILNTFNFVRIMRAFTNYSRNSIGLITIHPFTVIAPYQNMHENISKLAQDNLLPLVIVPYHENQRATQGNQVASSIQVLNTNLQKHAPCTVGILVDRHFCNSSSGQFSYDVAIIFIGGRDDREALAYAAQMSHHPNVSITVIRVISLDKKDHDENDSEYVKMDRMMDEDVYDGFKMKNVDNTCVVCWEILVDDILRVVDPIRSSGRHYDLVMVGQRHSDDEEMPAFATNDDLGVVGDIIYASFNLYGGWSSLLVLKHCGDYF